MYTMDHPDLIASNLMEQSVCLQRNKMMQMISWFLKSFELMQKFGNFMKFNQLVIKLWLRMDFGRMEEKTEGKMNQKTNPL